MADVTTALAVAMLELADRDQLDPDHQMRKLALDFDAKSKAYWGHDGTVTIQQFMGSWARARRAFTEYRGEGLMAPLRPGIEK